MNSLYIDSSSLIRIDIGEHDGARMERLVQRYQADGAALVTSRLLHLECRRVAIRLNLEGHSNSAIERYARMFQPLPLDEDVWRAAMNIRQHVKTLDAIHLATCALVPNAVLLSSDASMQEVAPKLGIKLV
ncbi:MAG: type II toxin-antitoxin system VapC family toxin [Promicromonosporaceae bacterium]|nr:type II toxin-antitoxin system VapC family toxin [Promicromonosporaceae bacterium]